MRGIDPKWPALLSALVAIELAIGHGTVQLTNAIPAPWIPAVQAWCNILAFFGTTISALLSTYSSATAGPMINTPTSTVAKAIIVALAASLLFMPTDSKADPVADAKADLAKLGVKPLPTLKIVKVAPTASAPAPAPQTPAQSLDAFMAKLEAVTGKLVADVTADLQAADADAGTVVLQAVGTTPATVRDPISHACYPALIQFLGSLPAATPVQGNIIVAQLFQKKRDFIAQIQAGLPSYLKLGCAALLGDEVKILTTALGMVGITVATGGLGGLLPAATLPALPILGL